MIKFLLFIILSMTVLEAQATSLLDTRLWTADSQMQKGEYSVAKDHYLKVQVNDPHNPRLNYNLGVAHYREGTYLQAVNSFKRGAENAETEFLKEKSLYNLGNAFYMIEKYKEAVDVYEAALEIDPNDEDAKHNLELAKEKLNEQEQNENKDKDGNNKDDKKDQDKKDDKQDQDKDQDKRDDKQDQNQDQQQQEQEQQRQQQRKQDQMQKNIESLLRQVQEASPAQVKQEKGRGGQPENKLNPW